MWYFAASRTKEAAMADLEIAMTSGEFIAYWKGRSDYTGTYSYELAKIAFLDTRVHWFDRHGGQFLCYRLKEQYRTPININAVRTFTKNAYPDMFRSTVA
jgi:hypothetical protein